MTFMMILILAVAIISAVIGELIGFRRASRSEAGLSPVDAGLYRRAAKMLNRLINVTDLDGDFAADVLSERTRKQVEEWVTDYKKELDKK